MILTIKGNGVSAAFDTCGAELCSFTDLAGRERVWQRSPEFWMNSAPILFPNIGNARDGKTIFNGKTYPMPKHGLVRNVEFAVEESSENSLTLVRRSTEEDKEHFPFAFEIRFKAYFEGDTLHMVFLPKNLSDETMPYLIGGHPAFLCPMEEGKSFSDYELCFEKEEDLEGPVFNFDKFAFDTENTKPYLKKERCFSLRYEDFVSDAVVFPSPLLKSRSVRVQDKDTKKGLRFDFPDFGTLAVWTPMKGGAPFLCLEPWNGMAIRTDEDDNFTSRMDCQYLSPGEERAYRMAVKMDEE